MHSLYPPSPSTPKVYHPPPMFKTPFKDAIEPSSNVYPQTPKNNFSKIKIVKKRTPPFEK